MALYSVRNIIQFRYDVQHLYTIIIPMISLLLFDTKELGDKKRLEYNRESEEKESLEDNRKSEEKENLEVVFLFNIFNYSFFFN